MKRIILLLTFITILGGYSGNKETINYKEENLFTEGLKQEDKTLDEITDILNKQKLLKQKELQEKQLKEEQKKKTVKKATTKKIPTKKTSKNKTTTKGVSYSKSELQSYAYSLVMSYGWSESDYINLVKLWNRESSWNPNAVNKKSGACGVPQSLPCSKMKSAGNDYKTNGKTQIRWGLSYIKNRYGSPSNAWLHSKQRGWY